MEDTPELPEAIKELKIKPSSVFMRTVVKREVYDKLKDIAQEFSTGNGHWDFGVAIQILINYYEGSKIAIQSDKIDNILHLLSMNQVEEKEPPKEEEFIEMLGGSKVSKK